MARTIAPPALSGSPSVGSSASSIKVVSELTALPMGTLRAWERRYGFPKPVRRAGSNRRLYSVDQVRHLQAIARALDRGYRPGDVIHLPRPELDALLDGSEGVAAERVVASVATLIELLVTDDVERIEDELRLAAAALGPRRFVTELCQPLAQAVGQAWADGKLAIRHEHLLTECLTTKLRGLLATHQAVEGAPSVLLTTLPGEPHTLGLQMVALYLALSGANARLLGPMTPPDQIAAAARVLDVEVVGVALTPAADLGPARSDLEQLRRALPARIELWLGGSGANLLSRLPRRVSSVQTWQALDAALARTRARTANRG